MELLCETRDRVVPLTWDMELQDADEDAGPWVGWMCWVGSVHLSAAAPDGFLMCSTYFSPCTRDLCEHRKTNSEPRWRRGVCAAAAVRCLDPVERETPSLPPSHSLSLSFLAIFPKIPRLTLSTDAAVLISLQPARLVRRSSELGTGNMSSFMF